MAEAKDSLRTRETLDREERYYLDQLAREEKRIAHLKGTRRRRILQRSVSLFCGIVLMLFGFIDLIVVKSMEANFNNVFIFILAEFVSIPCLRYGLVLFRKMPIEQELTAAAEEVMNIHLSLAQLREERIAMMRTPIREARTIAPAAATAEEFFRTEPTAKQDASLVCPDCGENIQQDTKICRNCGHLFI